MAYGQDGHIGISFQDSLGTAEVGSMDYFNFVSESFNETIEMLMSESLQSRYEEPSDYEGMHSIEGELELEVHPHLVGKLLKAWCGQSSQDSFINSCYHHLFRPLTADWDEEKSALQPMTIEVYRDTGSAYQYFDCLLNTLVFEIAQGTLYKCTAGFIGAQFAWMSKSVPSYITGSYFAWDVVSVQIGGSAMDDVSNLTVTCNNNLVGKAYLDGNKYFGRILRDGYRTTEIAGTVLLSGDAEVRAFRALTQQRLQITATDPATVMGGNNKFELDIPKMLYTEYPTQIGGIGLLEVGFTAKGKYDATSSYMVEFMLVNTSDAY